MTDLDRILAEQRACLPYIAAGNELAMLGASDWVKEEILLMEENGYHEFLESKIRTVQPCGFAVADSDIHQSLFPFQRDLVRWAVRKGRCAIFADTGLGKTRMQLEWARLLQCRVLIVAPLAVAKQTVREAADIGTCVTYANSQSAASGTIVITNYERLDGFDMSQFGAVVLDESSILKALDGKTRRKLTESCRNVPYRLCCTATPAPNDITEIANHAELVVV